jgi:hypothetical protein
VFLGDNPRPLKPPEVMVGEVPIHLRAGVPRQRGLLGMLQSPKVGPQPGQRMTEREITVTERGLNGGAPTNIPSVWMVKGEPKVVDDRTAVQYAIEYQQRLNWQFPRFMTTHQAERAAQARSDAGGTFDGPLGTPK